MNTYGIVHKPLVVKVLANRSCASKRVAFVGRQLALFERGVKLPDVGELVEVMITRALFHTFPVGHPRAGQINEEHVRAILLRPVDHDRHHLVAIDGFEMFGNFDKSVAVGIMTDGTRQFITGTIADYGHKLKLLPGRTGVYVCSRINMHHPPEPASDSLRPTNVWIDKSHAEELGWTTIPIVGLTRLLDASWARFTRRPKPTLREERRASDAA